jgi:spore germination cell wall hydrolase CwlJ-like protein
VVVAVAVAAPLLIATPEIGEARPRTSIETSLKKQKLKRTKKKVRSFKRSRRAKAKARKPRKQYTNIEKGCVVLDPEDRDLIVRTVMGEANNEPYLGKVAVAAVVKNRLMDGGFGGRDVRSVLFKPKQFEPWNTRRGELMSYGPGSRGWDEAEAAVDEAFSGNDPTNGATHFANVGTVAARGNTSALRWLRNMSNVSRIKGSGHTFGNADAGRGGGGVREIDGGDYRPGGSDIFRELGLSDNADDSDLDGLFSLGMASLQEETNDPRRQAVRSLIFEILDGLPPLSDGQGQAVAPESVGAADEEEEA